MKQFAVILSVLWIGLCDAQVGIGTVTPSAASMLEISSTANGGSTYKGFMPPRVPTQTARDAINPSSTDIGLLVFVLETGTLEIWNGISWEPFHTLSTNITTLRAQDFDTNISWSYSLSPGPYIVNDDIWDIVNTIGSGNANMNLMSGNFLGCRDLNNPNGGGPFVHRIDFVNVDISSLTNPRIAFDYDIFEFDNGDDVSYEVFFDDSSQGVVTLLNGSSNLSSEGTETITVPFGVTQVRLSVLIEQNGAADYAGFDNFRVYGQ